MLISTGLALRFKWQKSVNKSIWSRVWARFIELKWQRRFQITALLLGCLIAVIWTYGFRFTLFDVGLFHQVLWSLTHGHGFLSTISGSGDHIKDHLSLSFIALAPFFYLTAGAAWFLPLAYVLLVALGLSAWFYLAKRLFPGKDGLDVWIRVTIVIVALSMNSLWGNLAWGFHETTLAFAGFSWAYVLLLAPSVTQVKTSWLDCYRRPLAGAAFLLAALSKETALLDAVVVTFCCGVLALRRKRWNSIFLLMVAVAFAALFIWFETQPKPADKNYITRYYGYLGSNLRDFGFNLLFHPQRVIEVIGVGELARFAWTLFAPFAALPVLFVFLVWGKRKSRDAVNHDLLSVFSAVLLVSVLPNLLTMAISTLADLRQSRFHYVMAVWPAFAAISMVALKYLASRWGQSRVRSFLISWILLSQMTWDRDPMWLLHLGLRDLRSSWGSQEALNAIGKDDSVSADERIGPWLSNRELITRWPEIKLFGNSCPDWIVLHKDQSKELSRHNCGVSTVHMNLEEPGLWAVYKVNKAFDKSQE